MVRSSREKEDTKVYATYYHSLKKYKLLEQMMIILDNSESRSTALDATAVKQTTP